MSRMFGPCTCLSPIVSHPPWSKLFVFVWIIHNTTTSPFLPFWRFLSSVVKIHFNIFVLWSAPVALNDYPQKNIHFLGYEENFMLLEQSGFAAWDKTKCIFPLQYTIGLRKDRKHKFFWTFLKSGPLYSVVCIMARGQGSVDVLGVTVGPQGVSWWLS